MASKASRAQARRRKRERAEALSVEKTQLSDVDLVSDLDDTHIPTHPTPFITVESDSEDNLNPSPAPDLEEIHWVKIQHTHDTKDDQLDPSDMVHFIRAGVADSSDDDECDQELFTGVMFPVFTQPCPSQPTVGKRKRRSGGILKHYRRPTVDPITGRAIHTKTPTTSKHNYKINNVKALGKNNKTMSNWLTQANLASRVSSFMTGLDSPPHSALLNPPNSSRLSTRFEFEPINHSSNSNSDHSVSAESDQEAEINLDIDTESNVALLTENNQLNNQNNDYLNSWIDQCVDNYRNSKPVQTGQSLAKKTKQTANDRFNKLKQSLIDVSMKYQDQAKTQPGFRCPDLLIADLHEYNS
ncbi:uncharacterized protein MELLADRAFT_86307 [Melampsora larici-populina 98AG31]|uniref:Uncharacterized protein n=1 Tax=Melampsora larici-populina (strain 98AG31 / pathotype 3-4-7) TaxID=747676 RepID=F4RLA0_MELLP|nr:uncharacterized protein MELLADRAFT_86307 [Melampsora larici-populina 98AG31]EGG06872.1 hypothetical protein MELLADRAFT_86307 [Melampsora larici-populina 98AG31]